jgi:hypothetical protein
MSIFYEIEFAKYILPYPGWGRLWQDSGAAPDFHQHGEVVLPTARPGGEVGSLSL